MDNIVYMDDLVNALLSKTKSGLIRWGVVNSRIFSTDISGNTITIFAVAEEGSNASSTSNVSSLNNLVTGVSSEGFGARTSTLDKNRQAYEITIMENSGNPLQSCTVTSDDPLYSACAELWEAARKSSRTLRYSLRDLVREVEKIS